MPMRARRVCSHGGCFRKAEPGHGQCKGHLQQENRDSHPHRSLYDTVAWRTLRADHISANPLCAEHLKAGEVVPGTDVDHIVPHGGDEDLFFDPSNLQTLCSTCHGRKTQREVRARSHRA